MKLSRAFRETLQKKTRPLFVTAMEAGFHPSRLSRLINGERVKRPHDVRFRLLAKLIGFEGQIFEEEQGELFPQYKI